MPPHVALPSVAASQTLLTRARLLQEAALGAQGPQVQLRLLQGRHMGLLCAGAAVTGAEAELFQHAAESLGAQVVRLQPAVDADGLEELGRMLGRLYDAVECQGLAPAQVRALQRSAGVPVFEALAGAEHPSAALATLLTGPGSAEDKRRWLLQAALLEGLG